MANHSRLGILLLVVAIVGWFAVVKNYQIKEFSRLALDAKARSVELKSYDQRLNDLKFIKDQGDAVQKTLRSMYLAMPRQSQIPEVLVMMESIGANSGVVFSGVTLGTPTGATADVVSAANLSADAGIAEVPVTVSFAGNLAATTKFIDAVQKNIRTATIKSQTITADKTGNMNVTMQLGLVYQGGN